MGKGQGIGFAIPARQIATALSEILAPESTDGVWFGARVRSENDGWLHVSFVQPGSPSDKAGMKVGQRILQVNGKTPSSMIQFNRALAAGKNREATLQVVEGIQRRELKVQFVAFDDLIKQKLGLTLLKLNPEMAANFRLNAGQGLFIEQVAKDGPAERAELQRGFVLTAIDGKNTGDPLQVADVLSTKSPGENAALTVVVPQRINNGFVRLDQVTINVVVR